MASDNDVLLFSLQFFADGASASDGAASEAGADNSVNTVDGAGSAKGYDNDLFFDADEHAGNNESVIEEKAPTPKAEESFDDLIGKNGRFREEYEKRTQKLIQDRLRSSKGAEEKLSQVQKALDLLSVRYGIDKNDISAITDAVLSDNDLLESKAVEMGMDIPSYREFIKTQAENERLQNEINSFNLQERSKQIQNKWVEDSESLKSEFPNFDLQAEIDSNKAFSDLLTKGISVADAYRLTHYDEIITSLRNKTASEAKQATVNDIRAKGLRPRESDGKQTTPLRIKKSVSELTDADIEKIQELARKGVNVSF